MVNSETVSLTLNAAAWRSMFELICEPIGHCLWHTPKVNIRDGRTSSHLGGVKGNNTQYVSNSPIKCKMGHWGEAAKMPVGLAPRSPGCSPWWKIWERTQCPSPVTLLLAEGGGVGVGRRETVQEIVPDLPSQLLLVLGELEWFHRKGERKGSQPRRKLV